MPTRTRRIWWLRRAVRRSVLRRRLPCFWRWSWAAPNGPWGLRRRRRNARASGRSRRVILRRELLGTRTFHNRREVRRADRPRSAGGVKTDRVDTGKLLSLLQRWAAGETLINRLIGGPCAQEPPAAPAAAAGHHRHIAAISAWSIKGSVAVGGRRCAASPRRWRGAGCGINPPAR